MIVDERVLATAYGGDPVGVISEFSVPEAFIDTRYVVCDGRAISRTIYAAYFNMVGTLYGNGDGSTTFNVPDKRGRFTVGADDMGGTAANRIPGCSFTWAAGNMYMQLTTDHMPAHSHVVNAHSHGGATGGQSQSHLHDLQNHQHWASGTTSGDGSHNHTNIFPNLFVQGFAGLLDLHDGGSSIGYVNRQLDYDGTHTHTYGGWTGGPNINNTGWTDRDHAHGIGAESPGTSEVGSGVPFQLLPPFITMNYAVRVL
jgi:microcystin-dependent protein